MTKKQLRTEIAHMIHETNVEATEEGWIMYEEAEKTADDIIRLLSTVYNLQEIVH